MSGQISRAEFKETCTAGCKHLKNVILVFWLLNVSKALGGKNFLQETQKLLGGLQFDHVH
jgi:hypothetical protein